MVSTKIIFNVFFVVILYNQDFVSTHPHSSYKCPANFSVCRKPIEIDRSLLEGVWFVQESSYASFIAPNGTCITVDRKLEGSKLIANLSYLEKGYKRINETYTGTLEEGGKVSTVLPGGIPVSSQFIALTPGLTIIGTCIDDPSSPFTGLQIRIATKLQYPECGEIDRAYKILAECGVFPEDFLSQDQSECDC